MVPELKLYVFRQGEHVPLFREISFAHNDDANGSRSPPPTQVEFHPVISGESEKSVAA
jgi:hypothetical protein